MASETTALVPLHSTDEHVEEKKGCDKVQNLEQESAFPSKEIGESNEKEMVHEEGAASGQAAESEPEKNTDDEKIHPPAVLELLKSKENEKAFVSDVSVDDGLKEADRSDQTPILSPVPEKTVEIAEREKDNQPQMFDVPQPSTEAEVTSVNLESEVKAEKDPDDLEYKMEEVNKPKEVSETSVVLGSAPQDEIKPKDHSDLSDVPKEIPEMGEKQKEKSTASVAPQQAFNVNGEVEKTETLEVEGSEVIEASKDEKSLIKSDSSKEERSVAEKENLVNNPSNFEGDQNADVVEVLSKEAAGASLSSTSSAGLIKDIENKSVTEISENTLKLEDKVKEEKEEQNIETDAINTLYTSVLNSAAEVAKDSLVSGKTARDVETVTEEKEKKVEKGLMPTSVEATEVPDLGRADSTKTIENPKESELEEKIMEPIEATVDSKLEKAVRENEAPLKSESVNVAAPSSDHGDRETAKEVTKHELPAKPVHGQSHSIISKVKKSVSKLKKTIMGKSPSSKTMSSEGKGEIAMK